MKALYSSPLACTRPSTFNRPTILQNVVAVLQVVTATLSEEGLASVLTSSSASAGDVRLAFECARFRPHTCLDINLGHNALQVVWPTKANIAPQQHLCHTV